MAGGLVRWIILGLAVARATRFVTSDFLGEWVLVGPLKRWAWRKGTDGYSPLELAKADPVPTPRPQAGWRAKLVKGLDCPFCVGFWIGAVAVVLELAIPHSTASRSGQALRGAWKAGKAAFAMNYVVGHVSKRLDG